MSYHQESYRSRTKFIVDAIHKKGKTLKILDIGCVGAGNTIHPVVVSETSSYFKSYDAMDIDSAVNDMQSSCGVTYSQQSIYDLDKIGSLEGKFDVIVLTEVIEHLQDTLKAMKALKFVLAKDGVLLITYPNPFSLRPLIKFLLTNDPLSEKQVKSFCGCPDHIFIPPLPVFHRYLESVGLKISEVGYLKPEFGFKFFRKFAPYLGLKINKQDF